MTRLLTIARALPITLAAILGGTFLILCNPGLFWDDWVWIFQDPAENIKIGKELGVWWAGYLNNYLYSLPNPVLVLRIVALVAWVVTAGAFAYTARRLRYVTRADAFALFLLYCVCHAGLIRFINSVALYNVYIASFWIGCALLVTWTDDRRKRIASLPFFFLSFYLNSLLVLYGVVLLCLWGRLWRKRNALKPMPTYRANDLLRKAALRREVVATWCTYAKAQAFAFVRAYLAFLLLPLFSFGLIRMSRVKSDMYASYNEIGADLFLKGVVRSFAIIFRTMRDFFVTAFTSDPDMTAWFVILAIACCFLMLRLARRSRYKAPPANARAQAGMGLVLFAAGVFPYLAVGKMPELDSFYDSRHILAAVPGMALVLLAILNVASRVLSHWTLGRNYGKDVLLAGLLGLSIGYGISAGIELWRDDFRQSAIASFLASERSKLDGYKTFIFVDTTQGMKIGNRTIWNYEYTGNLIKVFGGRNKFGVSIEEYTTWPKKIRLLSDADFRKRYNIEHYRFDGKHAIIRMHNSLSDLSSLDVLKLVGDYLQGRPYQDSIAKYFEFELSAEYLEADSRVAEIYRVFDALKAYRRDHGVFPLSAPSVAVGHDMLPVYAISDQSARFAPPAAYNKIPGLAPRYLAGVTPPVGLPDGMPGFIYMSDGYDFKIVFANPPDFSYVKQAHPDLVDPVRPAYGLWTYGAANW